MSNETISNKPAGRVLDLTSGSITGTMLRFALPMIAGNLLQQLYNVADTLIVGRFLGSVALAAVGSSYTLMTFLTSILTEKRISPACAPAFSLLSRLSPR